PPSLITKPSRPRSKGRDAARGSSLRRDRARRLPKPASDIGLTAMSQAPARHTSTQPSRSQARAWAKATLPLAQAAEIDAAGPESPRAAIVRSTRDLSPVVGCQVPGV